MNAETLNPSAESRTEMVREKARRRQGGFTLTEMIVVVYIVGLLSAIVSSTLIDKFDKARLAVCMTNMRGIQSTVYLYSNGGLQFPDPQSFWDMAWRGIRPGPFYYLVDNDDPNRGHGNDLDGFDEQNPGKSKREAKDIKFVIVCQHDHKDLASYVYIEDEGPPRLAQPGADPNYERFIKWEFGGPGGGGNGDDNGGGKPPPKPKK